MFERGQIWRNLALLGRGTGSNLLAQNFIRKRSQMRWFAHFCFAWGCLLATAVTFPLVFGWVHFETRPDDPLYLPGVPVWLDGR